VIRASLLVDIRFDSTLTIGEDTLFLAEVLLKCDKICSVHDRYYYYFISEKSAYHSEFSRNKFDEIVAWERLCKHWNNENASVVAYAYRMQWLWKRYRTVTDFKKHCMKDIKYRYKKVKLQVVRYYIKNGLWDKGLKVFVYDFIFKLSAVL